MDLFRGVSAAIVASLTFAFLSQIANAEDTYPAKPIHMIIPFAAGGPTDKVARDLAEAMRKPLGGQSIIIENTAGAGGTIATNKVAKSPNDGYTLLLHHIGISTAPSLYRTLPFKTLEQQVCQLVGGKLSGPEQGIYAAVGVGPIKTCS